MQYVPNYTVRWWLQDGSTDSEVLFDSIESANEFAARIHGRDYITKVMVLRAGRHPSAPRWTTATPKIKRDRAKVPSVLVHEEAWKETPGFVDGDADKHGPKVIVPYSALRIEKRSDEEKVAWYSTYKPVDRPLHGRLS